MKRTQIQLTKEQTEQLDEMAREQGVSRSELIRQAVDRWLDTRSASSSEERLQRAKEAVGRHASGENDVSSRHDEYLEEEYAS